MNTNLASLELHFKTQNYSFLISTKFLPALRRELYPQRPKARVSVLDIYRREAGVPLIVL
jgi:hypothetical protein